MKNLIKHILMNNMDEVIAKSFLNCHVKGLHSLMLLDAPGKMIRMYVTTHNHVLYTNTHLSFLEKMGSLAYHPHHCDLTIDVIKGSLTNHIIHPSTCGHEGYEYAYRSGIKNSAGKFVYKGVQRFMFGESTKLIEGNSLFMYADCIHTIEVPRGEVCAWMVYEGAEDPKYKNLAYSTKNDLHTNSFKGLYQKPTQNQVMELLFISGLIK